MSLLDHLIAYRRWNAAQGVSQADMLNAELVQIRNQVNLLALLLGDTDRQSRTGIPRGHFLCTESGANVVVGSGVAFIRNSSASDATFVEDHMSLAVLAAADSVAPSTPGAYPRVDVVVVSASSANDTTGSEAILSGGSITSSSLPTRSVKTASLQVIEGTAGSYAVPAVPAGYASVLYVLHTGSGAKTFYEGREPLRISNVLLPIDLADHVIDTGAYTAENMALEPIAGTMTMFFGGGQAWVSGHAVLARPQVLTFAASDPTNPRIDVVAVQADGSVTVTTGTPAASPTVPAFTGLGLYQVPIPAASTSSGSFVPLVFLWSGQENKPIDGSQFQANLASTGTTWTVALGTGASEGLQYSGYANWGNGNSFTGTGTHTYDGSTVFWGAGSNLTIGDSTLVVNDSSTVTFSDLATMAFSTGTSASFNAGSTLYVQLGADLECGGDATFGGTVDVNGSLSIPHDTVVTGGSVTATPRYTVTPAALWGYPPGYSGGMTFDNTSGGSVSAGAMRATVTGGSPVSVELYADVTPPAYATATKVAVVGNAVDILAVQVEALSVSETGSATSLGTVNTTTSGATFDLELTLSAAFAATGQKKLVVRVTVYLPATTGDVTLYHASSLWSRSTLY